MMKKMPGSIRSWEAVKTRISHSYNRPVKNVNRSTWSRSTKAHVKPGVKSSKC